MIAFARHFLDEHFPLESCSHKEATAYSIEGGKLVVTTSRSKTGLKNTSQFKGFAGNSAAPSGILLQNNGIHIDIQINRDHPRFARFGDPDLQRVHILHADITRMIKV